MSRRDGFLRVALAVLAPTVAKMGGLHALMGEIMHARTTPSYNVHESRTEDRYNIVANGVPRPPRSKLSLTRLRHIFGGEGGGGLGGGGLGGGVEGSNFLFDTGMWVDHHG